MTTDRNGDDYLGSAYPFTVIRERMSRHPGPYLDFALGRHREPPPDWLPGFIEQHAGLALRRRQRDEVEAFVAAAASLLERVYGVRLSAASILPAPSGRAALSALAAVLIQPGDGVLVTEPGYPAFARIAVQRHARLSVAALDPDRDFVPRPPAGGAPVRVAALNYPNNPTGAVIAVNTLAALRRGVETDGVIFNDAIYGPLTYRRAPLSLLSDEFATASTPAMVELHSLGKLFSTGPLGLAFLAGDEERIERIRRYSDFAWTQLSSLQVRAATRCLEGWQHVEQVRDRLRERLDALREAVTALGFQPYPAEAGMYLLCRGPAAVGGRPVASAAETAELLLREHGLAVAPWDVAPHRYVRFSAAYLPEELERLAGLGRGGALVSG